VPPAGHRDGSLFSADVFNIELLGRPEGEGDRLIKGAPVAGAYFSGRPFSSNQMSPPAGFNRSNKIHFPSGDHTG
jgi:hypothetical protein